MHGMRVQKVEPFNPIKFLTSPMGLMAVGMIFVRSSCARTNAHASMRTMSTPPHHDLCSGAAVARACAFAQDCA